MAHERVTVVLTEIEMKTLRRLAQKELRRPRDQAAYILRTILLGDEVVSEIQNRQDARTYQGQSIEAVSVATL